MARLVEILNAAPVDGNPLNAIVNLEIDSTASDDAREKIARYLADNGYDAALENIAAFPCAPDVDMSFTSESQARINSNGKVEIETFVTIHATTTEAGAWYMAEILNQLSEENG